MLCRRVLTTFGEWGGPYLVSSFSLASSDLVWVGFLFLARCLPILSCIAIPSLHLLSTESTILDCIYRLAVIVIDDIHRLHSPFRTSSLALRIVCTGVCDSGLPPTPPTLPLTLISTWTFGIILLSVSHSSPALAIAETSAYGESCVLDNDAL